LVFDESFKNLKKEQFVLRLNQLNMTGDRDLKATDSFSLNGVVIDVLSKPYQPLSTVMGPFSIGLTRPTPAELNFARMDFIYTSKISASPILDDRPFDKKSSYYFIGGDQKSHSVNGMTFKHVAVSFENNNEIRLLGGALASNDPLYDQFTAVGLDESGVPVRFMVNSHGQDFEIQGNKFSSLDNVTVDSQGRLLVSTPGAFLVFTKFEHKRGKVDCSWIQYETASGKPQVCWVVVNHPFYRSIKVDSSRQIRSAFLKSETKIQGKICASEQWIEFDDKEKLINCKKP
jgi:hypothetical protein